MNNWGTTSSLTGRLRAVLGPELLDGIHRARGSYRPWDDSYRYEAVAIPGRAPDFIGLGVQKAGTSWWFSQLAAHPQVDVGELPHKELHFFSKGWRHELTEDGVGASYHQLFAASPEYVTGEWTPDYLYLPWCLPLIMESAPNARLLVLLRDPVARFVSGVSHDLRHGVRPQPRIVDVAIGRSLFGAQLQRLFAKVPREQVLVLQYERLRSDPDTWLALTHEFLGLEPSSSSRPNRRVNATRGAKYHPPPAVRAQLARSLAADRSVLLGLDLDLDLDLWQTL